MGSNVDTAVQLHVSIDLSNPHAFDTPRVADTITALPNSIMDNYFGSNNSLSSAVRLPLAEITQNPPVGSVECPPFTTPIYDRVLHEQENATKMKKYPKLCIFYTKVGASRPKYLPMESKDGRTSFRTTHYISMTTMLLIDCCSKIGQNFQISTEFCST